MIDSGAVDDSSAGRRETETLVSLRKAYGRTLRELGRTNQQIVVLDADLSKSTNTSQFAVEFPRRFFNMGISEQDMMGTAVGLASCDKIVFVSTFAIFASGRAWEQIRNSVCYTASNVNIVATHGGISVGPDGSSHQALEDVALMRVLPEMRVVVPCDDIETASAIRWAAANPGPKYIRLNRSDVPRTCDEDWTFEIGRARWLVHGEDITVIANGIMIPRTLEAARLLREEGISAGVVNMSTVKPIDRETVLDAGRRCGRIITIEEHSITGGLGSAVAEILAEEPLARHRALGIRNIFGESGDVENLLIKYGLTTGAIVEEAVKLVREE